MEAPATNGDPLCQDLEFFLSSASKFDGNSPYGDHKSEDASSKETLTTKVETLITKFDQLMEICQGNLLEIQRIKAKNLADVKPDPEPVAVGVQDLKVSNVKKMNNGERTAMENNSAKFLPAFEISNLGRSMELYEMLFEINGIDDTAARYRLTATAMLKGNCSGLFYEFRESNKDHQTYENLKEFISRRGRPHCKAENLLSQVDKSPSTRTVEDSLRLAQSIRSYNADTHAKIFLYNEVCRNDPPRSSLRDYLKRLMDKPFQEFEAACIMMKVHSTQNTDRFSYNDRKNYPPRTFVRSSAGKVTDQVNSNKCYFHRRFEEAAFKCEGGACTMINHPNVKFVNENRFTPVNDYRGQGNKPEQGNV